MRIPLLLLLLALPLGLTSCHRSAPTVAPATPSQGIPGTAAPAVPGATPSANAAQAALSTPQVVVEDDFQENQNGGMYQNISAAGVKPVPTDAPGSVWQLATGDGNYEANLTSPGELGTIVTFHNVASTGLSLASHGAYVKPTVMTVSAELAFGGDQPAGFAIVGFYSALSGEHTGLVTAHFTGLALQADGSLQLSENGKAAGASVKYTGKYDPSQWVTLTFSIDTRSGAISHISVSGSSSTYAMTSSAFTDAATAFLGLGGQTNGQDFAYFTKVKVVSGIVPAAPPITSDAQTNTTTTP